ncbi:MAG: ABC transporter ATP-binding protein [Bauldia sp.]|nr:ABC transporter ATP-binding protein [Bauldia sp.]
MSGPEQKLLEVDRLSVSFGRRENELRAVDALSFSIGAGEAVALVGESGCGKSTTAHAIMGLLPDGATRQGAVRFAGTELLGASRRTLQDIRGDKIGMIFQEPNSSLNPVYRVGDQIAEALRRHRSLSRRAARTRTLELLELVRLPHPSRQIDAYPHQLSGGQRQRAMIAMAICCQPKLLIADEPTTALDATIQAQIMELIDGLRRELSMALLLISHDLRLVARWTDRVVVMHHGEKLEDVAARELFETARHPYTLGLIAASVGLDRRLHYRKTTLAEVRTTREPQGGYAFAIHQPHRVADLPPASSETLLSVENLVAEYQTGSGTVRAVDDVSFTIKAGESLGLVGESGCGKSTLSKAIMRLIPSASGRIALRGRDITRLEGDELKRARRPMQMVFQDPYGSLNPRRSVGDILNATLVVNGVASGAERQQKIKAMLDQVGLLPSAIDRYPHEFSGGQRQRIGIARALIVEPEFVVCDEPVSALDVSIQAQILNLLVELKASLGLSYLFISHDLGVVQYISDRVMVMKDGVIIEEADHGTIWTSPRQAYTRELIAAVG